MPVTGDLPPFILPPPQPHAPAGAAPPYRVLAQLGAVLLFAAATFLAFIGAVFLALGLASSCGQPIDGHKTLLLKAGLGAVGTLWAAVPALVARLSRRVHPGLAVAWMLVAAAAAFVTLAAVVQAEASPVFCF